MSKTAKFLLVFFFVIGLVSIPKQVNADFEIPSDTLPPSKLKEINTVVTGETVQKNDGITNSAGTQASMIDNILGKLAGEIGGSAVGYAELDENGNPIQSAGLIGSMIKPIAYMYQTPTTNTAAYVARVLDQAKIGIAQPAYAQGLGFSALEPILDSWFFFLRLSYLFFVLIFMIIGFMIMFRQKVGQAAVTAQQAIPRIIIALVMVTFSYPIAGLLIEGMYVIMYMLVGMFGTTDTLIDKNIFDLGITLINSTNNDWGVIGEFTTAAMANITGGGTAAFLGWVSEITFAVIIVVTLAINIFKLFFDLLTTYVEIILSVVLAPILLMTGALPGKNAFGAWIKGLIGNLAAFPTVLVVLILHGRITASHTITDGGGFMPPYLTGQGTGDYMSTLIGLGMVLILPTIVKKSKEAFGAKGGPFEPFKQALADSVKQGIKGGQLVPGLGITDTSKYGISGKGALKASSVVGTGILGGVGGGLSGVSSYLFKQRSGDTILKRARTGATGGARAAADLTGSKFMNENRKERDKTPIYQVGRKIRQYTSKDGK